MPTPPEPRPNDPAAEPTTDATSAPPRSTPAVAIRPTATLRAASAPSRAEMATRSTLLQVTPWDDALLDQFGHDPRSPYVERFWLGVLGPSASTLARLPARNLAGPVSGSCTSDTTPYGLHL